MRGPGISIDPVCGRPVAEAQGVSVEYEQRRYWFCSPRCRAGFERQPERIHWGELARTGALFAPGKARWGVA